MPLPPTSHYHTHPLEYILEDRTLGMGTLSLPHQWAGSSILDTSLFCPGCRRIWARFIANYDILSGRCIDRFCYACGNGSLTYPLYPYHDTPPLAVLRREFLIGHEAYDNYWMADFSSVRLHFAEHPTPLINGAAQ